MLRNLFSLTKIATSNKFKFVSLGKQVGIVNNKIYFAFTSSSNPTQVALM